MALSKIICVVGPTASGKTDVGIALAKAVGGEVICADSRTIYKGMDIGTAKPIGVQGLPPSTGGIHDLFRDSPLVVDDVPHWGIDLVAPDESFTVADFQTYADNKIEEIIDRGRVPIIVGGTGLYISAVVDRPTFRGVAPSAELRAEIEAMTDQQIADEIGERDPDALVAIDEDNRRRLVRALEILRTSGKTLAESQSHEAPRYEALQIGIAVDREELYARIDARVDVMIAKGLVDEVRKLKDKYGSEANALTGIGYRQIVNFLDGKVKLRDAILRIKYDTHHYAKRQETWFKRDQRIRWIKDFTEAVEQVWEFL